MKLYTFYKESDKVVYGTFAEGKTQFFYSGFESAEQAKKATYDALLEYELSKLPPAKEGCIQRPRVMTEATVEMSLRGEWSEIE